MPQVERTKHVHSLHPYLGKFIPQLVEVFLDRYFGPGDCVYDPFVGLGDDARRGERLRCGRVGCDISAFNCLLTRVKTASHSLGALEMASAVADEAQAVDEARPAAADLVASDVVRARPLRELLAYRCGAREARPGDGRTWRGSSSAARLARLGGQLISISTSRARRSSSRTGATSTGALAVPSMKRSSSCAATRSTRSGGCARSRSFGAAPRSRSCTPTRARSISLPAHRVITSPPYPGLIDYHEQHRYAYELLGSRRPSRGGDRPGRSWPVTDRRSAPTSRTWSPSSRTRAGSSPLALPSSSWSTTRRISTPRSSGGQGLTLEERLTRHVNRRTGRRAGEFFEDVLVCSTR